MIASVNDPRLDWMMILLAGLISGLYFSSWKLISFIFFSSLFHSFMFLRSDPVFKVLISFYNFSTSLLYLLRSSDKLEQLQLWILSTAMIIYYELNKSMSSLGLSSGNSLSSFFIRFTIAKPRSASLALRPSLNIRILDGLRFLWSILFLWRKFAPRRIWVNRW